MNNKNHILVETKDLLDKPLNYDIVCGKNIIHKSGEVFTQETLEKCREKRVTVGPYYKNGLEEIWVPPSATSKKFYEVLVTPYTVYETYKVWADSKEQAIELVEEGDADPWDSDANRNSEIISIDECTKKELKRIEIEDRREIENAKKEIERLQKKIRNSAKG